MESAVNTLALGAVILAVAGCTQTPLLKPVSGNGASATVENPIVLGRARLAVVLGGKTYAGVAGEARKQATGEQARRFGWDRARKHPHIKQEMEYLFGSTILTAADGATLACDHLQHGDDWRLRCTRPGGGVIALQRVSK
jgi:hypothetical protein